MYLALNIFKQVEADQHAERLAAFSAYNTTDVELLACCRRFSELIPLLKKGSYAYRTLKLKYDSPAGCNALQLVLGAEIRY